MQILGTNPVTPLIVTGKGLGGSIASLFTISLLDKIGSTKNRPLCITFGSPLVGDRKLQQAISRSSNWNSCFIHVVSCNDSLPRLFITNYMPFGIFLFCSDSDSTCFENPTSSLDMIVTLSSKMGGQNKGFKLDEYGNIVENLRRKSIFKDVSTSAEDRTDPDSFVVNIRSKSIFKDVSTLAGDRTESDSLVKNIRRKSIFKDASTTARDRTHSVSRVIEISLQLQELGLTPNIPVREYLLENWLPPTNIRNRHYHFKILCISTFI